MKFYWVLFVVFFMPLTGCGSNTKRPVGPVPVEDRTVESPSQAKIYSNTEDEPAGDYADTRTRASSPLPGRAVLALLSEADQHTQSGDNGAAAAIIERALRLEPKNALLWHKLGLIKLKEKNYQQAINVARKSNSLAGGNVQLQVDNWQLIADANEAAGQFGEARKAREKATQLQPGK